MPSISLSTLLTLSILAASSPLPPLLSDARSLNVYHHTPASSSSPPTQPRSFPIYKKRSSRRTGDELIAWANQHRSNLLNKYHRNNPQTKRSRSQPSHSRRAQGYSSLTNYASDSTWYASVLVGTPATRHNLVLDTGSSDVWIAQSNYTPSASSSFVNQTKDFNITYGSGSVQGYLATETFTLAQHQITDQTFAVATSVGSGLLDGITDGIVGLGFQSLSTSGAQPIWQAAGENEFAFFLQTVDSDSGDSNGGGGGGGNPGIPDVPDEQRQRKRSPYYSYTSPGGIFTLGGTNTSCYTGDVNWLTVTNQQYWTVQLGGISVQDYSAGIGSLNSAVIDTGTTLLGGPEDVIKDLYSQIPGSSSIDAAEGFYSYPCRTTVNANITFGNQRYSLPPEDFEVSEISRGQCMGAFFSLGNVSSTSMDWIVGDVFLKSVYSIFSASGSTARVGFATLAQGLNNDRSSSVTVEQTQTISAAAAAAQPVIVFGQGRVNALAGLLLVSLSTYFLSMLILE